MTFISTKRLWGLFCSFLIINLLLAQAPAGYYSSAYNTQGAQLKTALYRIISPHTRLDYMSLPSQFRYTDWHPDGYFWDMYSNVRQSTWSGLNREHSLPKSWFGVGTGNEDNYDISVDLHNLFPSNPAANTAKSNYALGVVGSSVTYTNGVTKVGKNSFPGYTETVFEPANEYKGDFARTYMYMVTCYEQYASNWQSTGTSSMLQRNTYPVFNTYAVNLLMQWHRADPVSTKEINRNNEVYRFQGNQNPFIDHPLLAEYIWGKFIGNIWDGTADLPETDEPLVSYYTKADNTITVELNKPAEATYKIFSLTGVLMKTGQVDASGKILLTHEASGQVFENGMYILTVYAGTYRKTVRFIVG